MSDDKEAQKKIKKINELLDGINSKLMKGTEETDPFVFNLGDRRDLVTKRREDRCASGSSVDHRPVHHRY